MFAVEQLGRMGNALHQFAFGHALSRRLRTMWYLTDLGHLKYFALGNYRGIRGAVTRTAGQLSLRSRRTLGLIGDVTISNDRDPSEVKQTLVDGVVYKGYFQSVQYFEGFETQISELFTIRPEYARRFCDFRSSLPPKPLLAVHIRRTDYVPQGIDLPLSYYRRCLDRVPSLARYQIVFIGDDLPWARTHFATVPGAIFVTVDEIVDFQVLMAAEVAIISNSSFAWWAAFLNASPGKRVMAPRYWRGFPAAREDPAGVIPPQWEVVERAT